MTEVFEIAVGIAVVALAIKMLLLEKDVNELYRAICWLDGTKQEREEVSGGDENG